MGKNKTLSEAEIWDDSDLQTIWQDSIDEYQKYHSLHARGEDVAAVIRAAEAAESMTLNGQSDSHEDGDAMIGVVNGDEAGVDTEGVKDGEQVEAEAHQSTPVVGEEKVITSTSNGLPMPQSMIAQSCQDPALKELMMSWYWAGYYTGLYEGQRQGESKTSNRA